jgi:hypothetical protein
MHSRVLARLGVLGCCVLGMFAVPSIAAAYSSGPFSWTAPAGQTATFEGWSSAGSGTGMDVGTWSYNGETLTAVSAPGSALTIQPSSDTNGVFSQETDLSAPGTPASGNAASIARMVRGDRTISPYKMERLLHAPRSLVNKLARSLANQSARIADYTPGHVIHTYCQSNHGSGNIGYSQVCDLVYFLQYTGGSTCCYIGDQTDATGDTKAAHSINSLYASSWWDYKDVQTVNERPTDPQHVGDCSTSSFGLSAYGISWGNSQETWCQGSLTPDPQYCYGDLCGWGDTYNANTSGIYETGVNPTDETIVGWGENGGTSLKFSYYTG